MSMLKDDGHLGLNFIEWAFGHHFRRSSNFPTRVVSPAVPEYCSALSKFAKDKRVEQEGKLLGELSTCQRNDASMTTYTSLLPRSFSSVRCFWVLLPTLCLM
jgi:hypothetical protein